MGMRPEGRLVATPERLGDARIDAQALYERYGDAVFAFCLRHFDDRSEAEDVVQETFLNAWLSLRRGFEPEAPLAWLTTIARNLCANRYRARTSRVRTSPLDAHHEAPGQPGSIDDLMELTPLLRALPEQQRRAFLLYEVRGLSHREVAAKLGLSYAAVASLVFRARRELAERLREGDGVKVSAAKAAFGWASFLGTLKPILGGGATIKVVAAISVVPLVLLVPDDAPVARHQSRGADISLPATPSTPTAGDAVPPSFPRGVTVGLDARAVGVARRGSPAGAVRASKALLDLSSGSPANVHMAGASEPPQAVDARPEPGDGLVPIGGEGPPDSPPTVDPDPAAPVGGSADARFDSSSADERDAPWGAVGHSRARGAGLQRQGGSRPEPGSLAPVYDPPSDPGSQAHGEGSGPPADPASPGLGNDPPPEPGSQGQEKGNGPPADPGSQGQEKGNGPPADPGSQGQGQGNGNGPKADPVSRGQGQQEGSASDPGSQSQGSGPPSDPGSQGHGNGSPSDPGSRGQGNGSQSDPGSEGQGQAQSQGQGERAPSDPGPQGKGSGAPADQADGSANAKP